MKLWVDDAAHAAESRSKSNMQHILDELKSSVGDTLLKAAEVSPSEWTGVGKPARRTWAAAALQGQVAADAEHSSSPGAARLRQEGGQAAHGLTWLQGGRRIRHEGIALFPLGLKHLMVSPSIVRPNVAARCPVKLTAEGQQSLEPQARAPNATPRAWLAESTVVRELHPVATMWRLGVRLGVVLNSPSRAPPRPLPRWDRAAFPSLVSRPQQRKH